jgi:Ni,Fe-hydrogenase I cytochrome b subunit
MFVCLAIRHYKELCRVEDRARSGHLKSVRAEAAINAVWEQIRQNLLWKQIMSQKTEPINPIKSCLIRDDVHMRVHLHSKGHLLTPALKEI